MKKQSWEEEFDEIGFGNQAIIVGSKRVELKDFIKSNIIPHVQKEVAENIHHKMAMCLVNGKNLRETSDILTDFIQDIINQSKEDSNEAR